MRLYLHRAVLVSQGRLFHLSEMNHLTSLRMQPVGAAKTNIVAALDISLLSFFLLSVYSRQETDVMRNGEGISS